MDDSTFTPTVLFTFQSCKWTGDVKDMLTFARFREENPANLNNNHLKNPTEVVDFSKTFFKATKQAKQKELILAYFNSLES